MFESAAHTPDPGFDLDKALGVALRAVQAGCDELARGRARLGKLATSSKSPGDITTEVDRASEEAILAVLLQAYPDHACLGEEIGAAGSCEYRWVVDPLDGTVNYLHAIPYYAVSVSLERGGLPVVGVVADPTRGEVFAATLGGGAFINGERLGVSACAGLDQAVVGTVVPPPRWPGMDDYLAVLCAVAKRAAGVRRAGACALDLAYVAAGRLDAFFMLSLKRWDVSAGSLLVREAGGALAALPRLDAHPDTAPLAAAGPAVLPELLAVLER